ncbi:MAG: glycosyltransferase family 39 protein [Armatimonadota bacterium]|nr:glycosyltransferase family 39 protein [bacterium]
MKAKPNISAQQLTLPSWVPLLVFVALALRVGFLLYDRGFTSYDDGVAAEGARLVLQGEVPYRDFWTIYSPGSYYVNALGLAIFGGKLISIRLMGLLLNGVQAMFLYGILRRTCRNNLFGVAAAACYLVYMPIGMLGCWVTPGLAAIYSLIGVIENPKSCWLYICGLFLGITILIRQDAGLYLTSATLLVIYWTAVSFREKPLPLLAKPLIPMILTVGSAIAYFAAHNALAPMIKDTLYFSLFVFPHSRPMPYPMPWNEVLVIGQYSAPVLISALYQLTAFYILPAALIILTLLSVRRLVRSGYDREALPQVALFCIATVLFLLVGVRPSGARIGASVAMSLVAFAACSSWPSRGLRLASAVLLTISLVAYAPFAIYTVWAHRSYATSAIAGTGGVCAASGHAEVLAVTCAKVREITSPSERILCGAPIIYFIAGRDPGTRYYEPHPCLTDTPKVQRTIIKDIEHNHVRYFVRSHEWDFDNGYFTIEPNHQPKILVAYIERNYKVVYNYTLFQIYQRVTPFSTP